MEPREWWHEGNDPFPSDHWASGISTRTATLSWNCRRKCHCRCLIARMASECRGPKRGALHWLSATEPPIHPGVSTGSTAHQVHQEADGLGAPFHRLGLGVEPVSWMALEPQCCHSRRTSQQLWKTLKRIKKVLMGLQWYSVRSSQPHYQNWSFNGKLAIN